MFCFNCGEKVMDGAKFCSNCGANLTVLTGENTTACESVVSYPISNQETENQPVEEQMSVEQVVEVLFHNIFKGRREFGESAYLVGKDPITQEIKENLQDYYMSGDPNEKVLFVFDYNKKGLEEGFVITNQRLVWNFTTTGQQEIELLDIKEVLIGKAVLATVMNVVSFDNVRYKNIYLTGIRGETEFVVKFRRLIDDIYKVLKLRT